MLKKPPLPASPSFHLQGKLREILALASLGAAVFLALSLFSYHPGDPSINTILVSQNELNTPVKNLAGIIGAYTADLFFQSMGLCSYFLLMLLLGLPVALFANLTLSYFKHRLLGGFLFTLSFSALVFLVAPQVHLAGVAIKSGGVLGAFVLTALTTYFGKIGATLLLGLLLVISVLLLFQLSLSAAVAHIARLLVCGIGLVVQFWKDKKARFFKMRKLAKQKPVNILETIRTGVDWILSENEKPVVKEGLATAATIARNDLKDAKTKDRELATQDLLPFIDDDFGFRIPPTSMLIDPPKEEIKIDDQTLIMNAKLVEKKLSDFGVLGKVTEIKPGPVITMYEFEPAAGVKLNRIVSLSDDLAMAMRALSIRIIAPIPGKSVVGIEIPNNRRENVYFSELIKTSQFAAPENKLLIALGKTIEGEPYVADLRKMPHLLVAGATGAGKSVFINTLINSLLFGHTALSLRLILIDPKMLELSIYEGIPHMLLPVVTESKKAASALRWAVREMEDRYTLMAKFGVRHLEGYNKKVNRLNQLSKEKWDEELTKLGVKEIIDAKWEGKIHPMPFIVIIIDELADLIMVSSKDTEMLITRLAQMARASGIHMVLATQRPSTDVITGLIKANFPARISFQVASKYDSRTILDGVGAESLLGAGDMLFLPPASSKLERLHGAFISDQEINETVEFLKKQRTAPATPIALVPIENSNGNAEVTEDEFDGDLYAKAVEIVVESGKASISMIQRRMRIGYNRAARLIEKMEVEGIVGPSDGVKGREVLIGQSARENGKHV